MTLAKPMDLSRLDPDRFWSKVDKTGDCWVWMASLNTNGYGQFNLWNGGRTTTLAHRVAYSLAVGELDPSLTIDHLCRNIRCVNPAHLEQVTIGVNLARSGAPAILVELARERALKTHCPKGHAYAGDNVRYTPIGGRACKACGRESARACMRALRERRKLALGVGVASSSAASCAMTKNTGVGRGGKRKGSGRKPVADPLTERFSCRLTQDEMGAVRDVGVELREIVLAGVEAISRKHTSAAKSKRARLKDG